MSDPRAALERALNPRTVAVVGDKRASGYMWLRNLSTFTGKVYSVQVDPRDIEGIQALGVPNYLSLREIPDEIDYVVCAVPRQVAPRVLEDAAAKGVAGVGMFTSGFAETGEELGRQLQETVAGIARQAGIALIGPNCMGVYNPRLGLRFSAEQPAGVSGPVGVISQSGTHAINISLVAAAHGVYLSKAISIGNAAVLDVPDYLDYLGRDPDTTVIAMYVEGVRDGRRFRDVLREVAQRKPVVLWKGGQTEAGTRATLSHTASLTSSHAVWQALARQANCISVDSLDELIDVLQLLLRAKPSAGRRLALLAQTGGQSVVLTDAFAKVGMEVPELTAESYARLAEFFNIIGGSYRNPLDMAGTVNQHPEHLDRIFAIIDADPHIDAIVMELSALFMARRWLQHPEQFADLVERLERHRARSAKPFLTVLHPGHLEAEVASLRPRLQERGIPVLPSFERAARALARVTAYQRARAELEAAPA